VRYCEELGFSTDKASKLYICFGISSLAFRILTGIFLDRIKNSKRLKPQDVFQLAAFTVGLSIAVCPLLTTYLWLVIFFTIYGVTEGTFSTCINVIILNSVDKKQLGQAYGFWLLGFSIPMALGPAVAGKVSCSFCFAM
jgi:MFS family permease